MNSVTIRPNKLGDTRTATKVPTFEEFTDANISHTDDVAEMMYEISKYIRERGNCHDNTKIKEPYRSLFTENFVKRLRGKLIVLRTANGIPCTVKQRDTI